MIKREAIIFLIVGFITVVVDLTVYNILLTSDAINTNSSKGVGFLVALLFSYVANKNLTFRHADFLPGSLKRYIILYSITLMSNVTVNATMLASLSDFNNTILLSFFIATGVSSVMNFFGMKIFVFRSIQAEQIK